MIHSDPRKENRRQDASATKKTIGNQKAMDRQIASIREAHTAISGCSGQQLRQHMKSLQRFVRQRKSIIDPKMLALGVAVVNEGLCQVLGKNLYDVQILAGLVLCHGAVAEMQTGEGKTLTGLVPAVLKAISGRSVHVATPNSYLAERDHEQLAPVVAHLGMTAGLLGEDSDPTVRRQAYQCDITYGPGYAFGFDYLRDQLTLRSHDHTALGRRTLETLTGRRHEPSRMQRGQHFAILDEIDHVLIDDAMSPLVLSGSGDSEAVDAHIHQAACAATKLLKAGEHFEIRGQNRIDLTPIGFDHIYENEALACDMHLRRPWHEYVLLALRAKYVFERDVHYVIDKDEVRIIDATTGRIFEDRTWNDGQHQAVEAKETLRVTEERIALARITRQRFYRMYDQLSGMTGTATGCQDELAYVYGLPVISIPLRVPSRRQTLPTKISETLEQKSDQITAETADCSARKQPVLVGTLNIAESQRIAKCAQSAGLKFQLLNGIQDADEAEIVAAAGEPGAVTIATNMAGRGTDIPINEQSTAAGGLHVVVTENHLLDRVDRQLVGRCGRQGDPGTVRYFISHEDPIIAIHAPWIGRWLRRCERNGVVDTEQLLQLTKRVQQQQQRTWMNLRLRMLRDDLKQQELVAPSMKDEQIDARPVSAA